MNKTLELFLSKEYEDKINKKMMWYDYTFPKDEVISYIIKVIEVPVSDFMDNIFGITTGDTISAKDVFQFSSLNDATFRMCEEVFKYGNPGLTHIEAGKLLLNDGVKRKDGALTKYGENHVKTARDLGLMYEITGSYFLSCIGQVINELPEDKQEKLLVRLALRNKLVRRLLKTVQYGEVHAREVLGMLSDSTYTRRKPNVKKILSILEESSEYDFSTYLDRIIY